MPKPNQVAIFFKYFAEANPHSRGSLPSLVRHVNLPRLPALPNSPPGPSPLHRDRPLNKDKTGLAWPPGLPPCSPVPGTLRGTTRKGGGMMMQMMEVVRLFRELGPKVSKNSVRIPTVPGRTPCTRNLRGAHPQKMWEKGWRSKFACKSYTKSLTLDFFERSPFFGGAHPRRCARSGTGAIQAKESSSRERTRTNARRLRSIGAGQNLALDCVGYR